MEPGKAGEPGEVDVGRQTPPFIFSSSMSNIPPEKLLLLLRKSDSLPKTGAAFLTPLLPASEIWGLGFLRALHLQPLLQQTQAAGARALQ